MSRRRTSGEIINATLLEVFLALSFIVFGLAVFEKRRAVAAEQALERAPAAADLATLREAAAQARDSLAEARRMAILAADSLRVVRDELDSLRFASRYPPDCEPGASPPHLLTVTLAGNGQLSITMHRSISGFDRGGTFTTTTGQFAARFATLREYSRANGCRYLVSIRDTEVTSKEEYKRALAAINSTFRLRDFLR